MSDIFPTMFLVSKHGRQQGCNRIKYCSLSSAVFADQQGYFFTKRDVEGFVLPKILQLKTIYMPICCHVIILEEWRTNSRCQTGFIEKLFRSRWLATNSLCSWLQLLSKITIFDFSNFLEQRRKDWGPNARPRMVRKSRVIDPDRTDTVRRLGDEGKGYAQIGKVHGVSAASVYRSLAVESR